MGSSRVLRLLCWLYLPTWIDPLSEIYASVHCISGCNREHRSDRGYSDGDNLGHLVRPLPRLVCLELMRTGPDWELWRSSRCLHYWSDACVVANEVRNRPATETGSKSLLPTMYEVGLRLSNVSHGLNLARRSITEEENGTTSSQVGSGRQRR